MYLVYSTINPGDGSSNCMSFEEHRAVYDAAVSCIYEEGHRAAGSHCDYESWTASIQNLIPDYYPFSSTASDTSADGATNFAARFGDDWNDYIYHACVTGNAAEHQVACEHSNAAGNCIFDGGSDMYDIGNVIMTSLMAQNPYGGVAAIECGLGAISYETDFSPVATTCFGPGGYYEMAELDGVWIFFSQNFQATEPLTFGVIGNLGHDGTRPH